jgi:hypothetical protein
MSATDPSELDGYEALVSQLRADPPVAPERLRQRILERAPAARRRLSKRRRLALVVVPVAVVLAVGAALVHGFVSSGSQRSMQPTLGVAQGSAVVPGVATTVERSLDRANTPQKTAHLAAGKPKAVYGEALTGDSAVVIPKGRVVHATATLEVRVPSHAALSRATNQATQIVASLGGYAQSVQFQSLRSGDGNAFLSLRVPVGKAETAIGRLAGLGTLLSQQVSTQDLQQQLTRQTNQIGSLRRAIAVYEQALKSGALSPTQRVEIQIKLANAQHSLKLVRKARSGTVASGATADISLTLTTSKSGVIGGGHHRSGRFDRLLGSAGHFLALEGIIVLYALVVLSPVLVLGGVAWWLLRERRRREERLLAGA